MPRVYYEAIGAAISEAEKRIKKKKKRKKKYPEHSIYQEKARQRRKRDIIEQETGIKGRKY